MNADHHGPVAGVVLAAGASTRMGRNKLLLTIEGESVLRLAARRALDAGLDPVIVVLGHEAERMRQELSGLGCRVVLNADHAKGQTTSLRAGIAALPAGAPAAVVVLADMLFVTSEMLAALVQRFLAGGTPLVISDYDGVTAPPMLYARALFPEIEAMEGDSCGKRVVKAHRGEAAVLAWPASALSDLDVPDDYDRALGRLAVR
jgi:molybdenum cofactor cytidylyltransferase